KRAQASDFFAWLETPWGTFEANAQIARIGQSSPRTLGVDFQCCKQVGFFDGGGPGPIALRRECDQPLDDGDMGCRPLDVEKSESGRANRFLRAEQCQTDEVVQARRV